MKAAASLAAPAALFLAAMMLAGCEAAPAATFADAAITLPDDPMTLPDLPGREAVAANCLACHSPSTMLQQPRLTRDKWEGIARKMVEVYKAPVDEEAIPAIADYMVAVQQSGGVK